MKQKMTILPFVIILLTITSFINKHNSSNDYMDDYEQFITIINESFENASTYGAHDVFLTLEFNVASINAFNENVDGLPDLSSALEYIADEFEDIAESYQNIDTMSVLKNTKEQVDKVKKVVIDCDSVIKKLQKNMWAIRLEIQEIDQELIMYPDSIELKVLKEEKENLFSIEETKKIIFDSTFDEFKKLSEDFENYNNAFITLLLTLDSNSKMYIEAANLARITTTTIKQLETTLKKLENTNELADNVVKYWNRIDGIIKDINSHD